MEKTSESEFLERVKDADQERLSSITARDFEKTSAFLADDLTYAHATGPIDTKATLLQSMRESKAERRFQRRIDTMRALGTVAVMTGELRIELVAADKVGGMVMSFTGIWAKRDGSLQMLAWHSTKLRDL